MKEPTEFLQLINGYDEFNFAPDTVCHIKPVDLDQEIYGTPEYISALKSVFF